MTLLDALRTGTHGLRFAVPESCEVVEAAEGGALLRDPERKVAWEITRTSWRLDLDPENDEVLRRDIERHVRATFELHYNLVSDAPEGRNPPRTSDRGWSPVISLDTVSLGGAKALKVLYRLAYEPGNELIVGRVLVPLETGLCEIAAISRVRTTGFRESALLTVKMVENPGKSFEDLGLSQRHYDDPEYDLLFEHHPLTLVRGALSWLENESGLVVEAPMSAPPKGEIELPEAGVAITPPPRYLRLPAGTLAISPSLVMFTRVMLSGDQPRLLDVWRYGDEKIAGAESQARLLALARKNAREWEREGATDITMKPQSLPSSEGRFEALNVVDFKVAGRPTRSVSHWLADTDGQVFRVAIGAPPWVPKKEMVEEAAAVMRSLRRLDEPESGPREKGGEGGKKKWWKLW